MSTDTANYGFTKDNEDDFYNVNVVNANLDKIDTEMKRIEDSMPTISPTDSVKWIETVGGTANVLTATVPDITSYKNGLAVSFPANANSTAAITLNINNLGAIPIRNSNGNAVSNLKTNGVYTVRYRTGAFILQGESEVEIGKQIITPGTTNKGILQGVHDGTGYVEGSPNLLASNIRAGVNIFGIVGTAPIAPRWANREEIPIDVTTRIDWGGTRSANVYSSFSPTKGIMINGTIGAYAGNRYTGSMQTSQYVYVAIQIYGIGGGTWYLAYASIMNTSHADRQETSGVSILQGEDGVYITSAYTNQHFPSANLSNGFSIDHYMYAYDTGTPSMEATTKGKLIILK